MKTVLEILLVSAMVYMEIRFFESDRLKSDWWRRPFKW
jgi:hypothetical protein